MLTKMTVESGLKKISASGLKIFKKTDVDVYAEEFEKTSDHIFEEAVRLLLQEEKAPRNVMRYLKQKCKKNITNREQNKDLKKWYIIDNFCYRCNNYGMVPIIESHKSGFQKMISECNCAKAKSLNGVRYEHKYYDDHQFPFDQDVVYSGLKFRRIPRKVDYIEVFSVYSANFWKLNNQQKLEVIPKDPQIWYNYLAFQMENEKTTSQILQEAKSAIKKITANTMDWFDKA